MKSFACLIQTHTGQDKEGIWLGGSNRNRRKEAVGGKNTKCRRKRLLRQLDREQKMRESELEKIAPPPSPHPTRLYLSKQPSVLAQELKPLSPGAGAFSPRASASSAAGGRRGPAGLGKAGRLSERQLSDYSPPEGLRYRWKAPSSITPSIQPFSPRQPPHDSRSHQSWQGPQLAFRRRLDTAMGLTSAMWWINWAKKANCFKAVGFFWFHQFGDKEIYIWMFPLYCLSYTSLKGCRNINLQPSGQTLNHICAVKMLPNEREPVSSGKCYIHHSLHEFNWNEISFFSLISTGFIVVKACNGFSFTTEGRQQTYFYAIDCQSQQPPWWQ